MDWPILISVHIDWSILISVHMHADGESPNIQCTMRHQIFSHQALGASRYQFTIIHFLSDGESLSNSWRVAINDGESLST